MKIDSLFSHRWKPALLTACLLLIALGGAGRASDRMPELLPADDLVTPLMTSEIEAVSYRARVALPPLKNSVPEYPLTAQVELPPVPPEVTAAEEPVPPEVTAAEEDVAANPQDVPEPGAVSDEYRIRTGDTLTISIPFESGTDQTIPVRPDGRITYLFNIEIMAAGLTYRQLHDKLIVELNKYYRTPRVTVIGRSFAGNSVFVMGPVKNPGAHGIQNDTRLLDVLSTAGVLSMVPQQGNTSNEDQQENEIRELVDLDKAYIARGDKVLDIDFRALLIDRNLKHNILLMPKDFIFIPSRYLSGEWQQKVFVVGEVEQAGVYRSGRGSTFLEAISFARGILKETAQSRECYIVRRSEKTPLKVDYAGIVAGRERDIALQDGDIVYVPERKLRYGSRVATTVVSEILAPLQSLLDTDSMGKEYYRRKWGPAQ